MFDDDASTGFKTNGHDESMKKLLGTLKGFQQIVRGPFKNLIGYPNAKNKHARLEAMSHVPARIGGRINHQNYDGTVSMGIALLNEKQERMNSCLNYIPSKRWKRYIEACSTKQNLEDLVQQKIGYEVEAAHDQLDSRYGIGESGFIRLRKPQKRQNKNKKRDEQKDDDLDLPDQKDEELQNVNGSANDGTQSQNSQNNNQYSQQLLSSQDPDSYNDDSEIHEIKSDLFKVCPNLFYFVYECLCLLPYFERLHAFKFDQNSDFINFASAKTPFCS